MNYFELYPGDYLKATGRLTLVDHGAYLRLLLEYYATEEPLPAGLAELYVIAAAVTAADKAAVRKVADRFFPISPADGLRHNARVDEEIQKAQARIAAARQNGRSGGRPRKNPAGSEEKPSGFLVGSQNETQKKAHHTPHAITTPDRSPTPDGSLSAQDGARCVGTLAGHAAAALNRAGCRVNSHNPDLTAACGEGVTVDLLLEVRGQYPDKPAGYVIAAARRIHAETPRSIPPGGTHAAHRNNAPRESAADRVRRLAIEGEQRDRADGYADPNAVGAHG